MSNKIKDEIIKIEIPKELHERSMIGIQKAKREMTVRKMKRSWLLVLPAVTAIFALIFIAPNVTKEKLPTVISDANIAPIESKSQLVNDASLIISGTVVDSEVQNDFQGFPNTDYKIKVDETFKGNVFDKVEVRTYGGKNEKMIYIPDEHMVTFKVGEKVVLFLTDQKGERPDKNDFGYFVVGQYQGKFVKEKGVFENEKFSFDANNFSQEIHELQVNK